MRLPPLLNLNLEIGVFFMDVIRDPVGVGMR